MTMPWLLDELLASLAWVCKDVLSLTLLRPCVATSLSMARC